MTDEPMTAELAEAQEDALRRGQTASLQGSDRNRVLQRPEASTAVSLSMSTDGCVNVRIQALSAAASLDHYRERGNSAFKAGRYFDAVERYTACIQCAPQASVICNRALALMSLHKDAQIPESARGAWCLVGLRRALMDASRGAARLDPACAKAYYIAGACRLEIARLDEELGVEARVEMLSMAAETLHEAHKLEPADRRIYAKMEEAVAETVFAKRELKKLDDVRGEAAHATVSAAGGEQLHVHAADVDRRRAPSLADGRVASDEDGTLL